MEQVKTISDTFPTHPSRQVTNGLKIIAPGASITTSGWKMESGNPNVLRVDAQDLRKENAPMNTRKGFVRIATASRNANRYGRGIWNEKG